MIKLTEPALLLPSRREHEPSPSQRAADRAAAISWARNQLLQKNGALLDIETDGLAADRRVVQVALLSPAGDLLFESLVNPERPIPDEASRVHGITDAMVAGAPTFRELYPQLRAHLARPSVVAYNARFDKETLVSLCAMEGLPPLPETTWHCAMHWYARYYGQWQEKRGEYRWQRLPGGNHTARGDCLAIRTLLTEMARGTAPVYAPEVLASTLERRMRWPWLGRIAPRTLRRALLHYGKEALCLLFRSPT